MQNSEWEMKEMLTAAIHNAGGWVNTHAHLDRAFTIGLDNFKLANAHLHEKWSLIDEIKRTSTVNQIYDRMAFALEKQIKQGVTAVGTFIDVDSVIKTKAIKAAERIKEKFNGRDFQVLFINQTLKGVLDSDAKEWFEIGAEFADIIGGLPGKDKWFEEDHIDVVLEVAEKQGKLAHLHVDQLNTKIETETEWLADKTLKHKMENRVVAIHSVSLSAHPIEYRRNIYRMLRKAKVGVITCPTAWIDSRRSEELAPIHNSIAPIEELIENKITVALGTDNIADIYKPFTDGDMWTELRFLLETCHYYDIENLVKIATENGRKVLGLID